VHKASVCGCPFVRSGEGALYTTHIFNEGRGENHKACVLCRSESAFLCHQSTHFRLANNSQQNHRTHKSIGIHSTKNSTRCDFGQPQPQGDAKNESKTRLWKTSSARLRRRKTEPKNYALLPPLLLAFPQTTRCSKVATPATEPQGPRAPDRIIPTPSPPSFRTAYSLPPPLVRHAQW